MYRFVKNVFYVAIFLLTLQSKAEDTVRRPKNKLADKWVDSVYNTMSQHERIGQLFMIAAYSNKDSAHIREIDSLIVKYKIGGLIFMQGGPMRQARLTNRYQTESKIPLMIAIDGEWGLSMRLDSTVVFPKQMTMGALVNNKLIYDFGKEVGYQCKRMGIHVNFAPVVDVNNNRLNPVIGYRSFGEDVEKVTQKGTEYMRGMQSQGVLACAKHFPGHGDTDSDSHLSLPTIKHKKSRLDDIELYPFKKMIDDTLASIMVAHLYVPALDDEENKATTLSEKVVRKLLKNKLGFRGLIFTDALNMKGVSSYYAPGQVDKLAFMAGNDVLLFSQDVPRALKTLDSAINAKEIDEERLEESVKKILFYKYKVGLHKQKFVDTTNLIKDLNNPRAKAIRELIYRKAITLVKNNEALVPIKEVNNLKMACVLIDNEDDGVVANSFKRYAAIDYYFIDKKTELAHYQKLWDKISKYPLVTVVVGGLTNQAAKNFKLSNDCITFVKNLQLNTKVITVVLGNAYALSNFENAKTLICTYEENEITKALPAQLIFGGLVNTAQLPVSPSEKLDAKLLANTRIEKSRLGYIANPEIKGLNSAQLSRIDTIVKQSIAQKAMPGCQVLVIKDSSVVYSKAFGYHRYSLYSPVRDSSLYDIASVTKVACTLQGVMQLYSQNKINLASTLKEYLPETIGTNKQDLILQEILSHQAGLQAFISHWTYTLETPQKNFFYYSKQKDSTHTVQIADSLFTRADTKDSVWKWTLASKLIHRKDSCYQYKYSDIGFYIFQKIVEKGLGKSLDVFSDSLYASLGMRNTGYLPLRKFSKNNIVPSEWDKDFRAREICGYVNDEGASMYGGVAGHAGIFSNANDLAILFQMNLQDGYYGYKRYLGSGVMDVFKTRNYLNNRRGLGWDKPEWDGGGSTSIYCSQRTFGHTGFTGTCVWIDPKYNLIYIFLSNRTYPDPENKALIINNVRTKIQDVIYQSIMPDAVKY